MNQIRIYVYQGPTDSSPLYFCARRKTQPQTRMQQDLRNDSEKWLQMSCPKANAWSTGFLEFGLSLGTDPGLRHQLDLHESIELAYCNKTESMQP